MKARKLINAILIGIILMININSVYASSEAGQVMIYKDGKMVWVDADSQAVKDSVKLIKQNEIKTAPNQVIAEPTNQKITVDGKSTNFRAYNIGGYNYFMLRDIAHVFKGTKAQFEVGWDQEKFAINLETGKTYTGAGVGFEMKTPHVQEKGSKSKAIIYKNGQEALLLGYTINGSNFFKLRDLGDEFGFGVNWDTVNQTVVLQSDKDAPLPQPQPEPQPEEPKKEQPIDTSSAWIQDEKGKWVQNPYWDPFGTGDTTVFKDASPTTESQKQQMREDMLVLINKARKKEGLKSLVLNNKLTEMAEYKSADMAKENRMSHEGSYGNLQELINMYNVSYTTAGENILFGGLSAAEMFDTWWNSPGHKANMMNPKFGKIGIGFAEDKVISASIGYDPLDLEDIAVYNEVTGLYNVKKMSYWATQEFTN